VSLTPPGPPGRSPRNDNLESNGLTWVSVHGERGDQTVILVEPATGQLQNTVRFLRRSDDGLTDTPAGYRYDDGED
jgi:hypothetical protein